MLINVMHPEEARVAIVHDGRLMELNIEISGKEQVKGNIYKGVVLRVEPGLQAAFVDIGRARPGFLQMGELHPEFWQWRDDVPEDQRRRRPRIQEVLRRGQEILVQVEKDERDNKGSALTSYLSLPGRYMVIMPGSDSKGISRKVEQEGERKKLKEIVADMGIPEGVGYIIRTEAVGRSPEELKKDLDSLLELYETIKQQAASIKGAGEVYQDRGLIIRTIRDYFSDDIDEVLVDSKEAYREAKEFFRETMPKCEKRVKLHKEKRPIFSRFQLEEQIDQIYEKRVSLPSGGSLIIEPTEALVSIDVNSGKSSGERGIEDTAFKTNLEAAEEVARQLRLRDLGGLIVIDFIDMREKKHDIEVEKTLKQALKMDKARVNIGRISEFGMLEMSRQRIAKTLNDAIHLECPHCEGRGKVKSVEAMALSFLRKVHGAAAKGTVSEVRGGLPLEVAYYLLNRKKRELAQIENDYEIEVTVKGKTSYLLNQVELETVKREKPRSEELSAQSAPAEESPETEAGMTEDAVTVPSSEASGDAAVAADGGKKRKRRRKKKKAGGEVQPSSVAAEHTDMVEAEESDEGGGEDVEQQDGRADISADEASKPKKRKRRRRKKSGGGGETEVTSAASDAVAGAVTEVLSTIPAIDDHVDVNPSPEAPVPERKRQRTRKALRGEQPEPVQLPTVAEDATGQNADSQEGQQQKADAVPEKRKRGAARNRVAVIEPAGLAATGEPESLPTGDALITDTPKPSRRARKPKAPVITAGGAADVSSSVVAAVTDVPSEVSIPESGARRRTQRKKAVPEVEVPPVVEKPKRTRKK